MNEVFVDARLVAAEVQSCFTLSNFNVVSHTRRRVVISVKSRIKHIICRVFTQVIQLHPRRFRHDPACKLRLVFEVWSFLE